MTTVSVTDLRQHLAAWLDRVRNGEEIAITERGAVVARVVPAVDRKAEAKRYFEELRASGNFYLGDVVSPSPDWESDEP